MEWTRGPVIGRGSSAAVSLATTTTGQVIAVKSADVSASASLQNEQRLISQLCSPFTVKCFGSEITREKGNSVYNILLEYVAGGTLSDLVRNQGGSLDESAIRFYSHQLLKGLNYLHLGGFVHCDIKGQNLLIGDDGLTLKIADFGCAKWTECGGSAAAAPVFAGTPAYMAPEVARGEEQSFPSDIWAMGCTIVEMATGSNPWPEMKDPASALYRVAYSDDVPEIPRWFSEAGKDFLSRCFTRDSKERWTAAELLHHPFVASADVNCGELRKSTKRSPTSVMDQHFWDAVEVSDSSPDPTETPSTSDSPAGRIRGLIRDDVYRGWAAAEEEEEWLMVRDNGIEECMEIEESIRVVMETSIVVGDSFFDYSFRDGISSNTNISDFQYIPGDSDVDDSVSLTVTFETMVLIKELINSDHLFPAIFFPSLSLSLSLSLYWLYSWLFFFAKHGSKRNTLFSFFR